MKKQLNKPAFTLIEVVIAVTLMSVVLVAIGGLIIATLSANRRNIQSVQAAYLAQEGLEAMRYIRDSNWLQNYSWDEGVSIWGEKFVLNDFDPEKVMNLKEQSACPPCWGFSTEDEVIAFESGIEFTRSIEIHRVKDEKGFEMDDIYEIKAVIDWMDRGRERTFELSTYLSNWK